MDFQNRAGNKAGGGNVSNSERNVDRRERMRLLAMEITDLNKDPYILRNNIGTYECKLCGTSHNNEGNYLAHTQGKKHQTNLHNRQEKYSFSNIKSDMGNTNLKTIGKPTHIIEKYLNKNKQKTILFQIYYPEIKKESIPKHKIISSFEQKVEKRDINYQYIVFYADPYETIGIKITNQEIIMNDPELYKYGFNEENKIYYLLITFL